MRLSYSRLNRYRLCGMSYYFYYILGKKYPPTLDMYFGSCFHKTYEMFFKYKILTSKNLESRYLKEFFINEFNKNIEIRDTNNNDKDFYLKKGIGLIEMFYEIAITLNPLVSEKMYIVNLSDIEIYIKPDLIIDEGIVDFKTKKRKSEPDFNQLLLYYLAYKEIYKKIPILTFYDLIYTKTKTSIAKYSVMPDENLQPDILIKEIKSIIDGINNKIFMPAPINHWKCCNSYCEYYDECVYGKVRHESIKKIKK